MFEYSVTQKDPVIPTEKNTLGLHEALSHFYVDSNGVQKEFPKQIGKNQEKLARMQSKLSRMKQGSKNYEQQLGKIQRLHEHIANQRKDFLH